MSRQFTRRAKAFRPWPRLATFTMAMLALYGLVFLTGDRQPDPKLGIDLEGGTQVILTARTPGGQPPANDQLTLARQIIDQRVNGLGVSGAEVVQYGDEITIIVPGDQGRRAKDLAQTAQLRFRPVLGGPYDATQSPPTAATPSAPRSVPGADAAAASHARVQVGSHRPVAVLAPGAVSMPPHSPPESARHRIGIARGPISHQSGNEQGVDTVSDPELAKVIAQARAERQSLQQNVQQLAIQDLNCSDNDVLRGYDDPSRPLITCDERHTAKYLLGPSFLDGTQIDSASAGYDQQTAGNVVTLTFNPMGTTIWGDYTTRNVGKQAAFVLDTEVVSAPTIQGAIFGSTQISGSFSQTDAQQLAGVLKYGSLPLSFATSDAQTVSATLGLASLQAGLIAGAIGLALVFLYCLFYYRALGMLTILSLALSGVMVYAVLVLLGRSIGFTLDLAGVAGFIVAIGITADSFVIFFERLKDEVREGRSFRAAVPRGWLRARRTILSADGVSFLASAVLYLLAIGDVKGFAFTLGMSTILDLVVVFLVTHPLVALAASSRLFSSPTWSGLGAVARIGARRSLKAATATPIGRRRR
jgi:preprotein translocase subunit SecD